MGGGEPFGGFAIAALNGLPYLGVLRPDVAGLFVLQQHLTHHAHGVGQVRGHGGLDQLVATDFVNQFVELDVRHNHLGHMACGNAFASRIQKRMTLRNLGIRDQVGGTPTGHPLNRCADVIHIAHMLGVQVRHHHATGDGAFGFNAMEIDTAVRHQAPLLIVVANNGSWAIEVRDQQETHGRVVGTRLQFADHAAIARAFGLHAQRVEKAEDLPAAIQTALQNRPALLDVLVTPEAVSSDAKSGLAWVPDLQALEAWDKAETKWRG